jgi:radical SAM superfamily enzyme YgiQ (UPF0313 family)
MITSRGCPYRCQFCASAVLGGGQKDYWRGESAERIVDKVQFLYERHDCRFVDFWDNSFNIEPDRVVDICHELIKRRLNIRWACVMRANSAIVPTSMLTLMKRAGCWKIHYGAESGSPRILKTINKLLTVEEIQEAVVRTQQRGIEVRLLLMVGNPGESDESIDQTLDLVSRCRPMVVAAQPTRVYAGTALYDLAKSYGWIDDDYWLTDAELPFYPAADYLQCRKWLTRLRSISARCRPYYMAGSWMRTLQRYFTSREPPLFDRRKAVRSLSER